MFEWSAFKPQMMLRLVVLGQECGEKCLTQYMVKSSKVLYTIEGTDAQVEEQLAALEASDKAAEEQVAQAKSQSSNGCALAFGGGCLGPMMVGALVQNGALDWMPEPIWKGAIFALFLCIPIGLLKTMGGSSAGSAAAQGDVDDNRYKALMRLHAYMKADCPANANYHYQLELRPYVNPAFQVKQEKFGGWFSYPKGTLTYYETPVVDARCKLKDGSSVRLSVIRSTRYKDYAKRNYRGKVKYKRKIKFRDRYQVQIKRPQGWDQAVAQQPPTPSYLSELTGKQPKLQKNGNKVSAVLVVKSGDKPFDIDPLLRLAVWTFHHCHSKSPESTG